MKHMPASNAAVVVILIRLVVGGVFLSEGIQEFLALSVKVWLADG